MTPCAPACSAIVVSGLAHRVVPSLVVQPNVPPVIPLLGNELRAERQRADDPAGLPGAAIAMNGASDLPVRVQPIDIQNDAAPGAAESADLSTAGCSADIENS